MTAPVVLGWTAPERSGALPVSAARAAEVLRCRPDTIRDLVESGRLRGLRVGPRRGLRVYVPELEAALAVTPAACGHPYDPDATAAGTDAGTVSQNPPSTD